MDWKITAVPLTRVGPNQSCILKTHYINTINLKKVIRGKAVNNINHIDFLKCFLALCLSIQRKRNTSYCFELNHQGEEPKVSPKGVCLQVLLL